MKFADSFDTENNGGFRSDLRRSGKPLIGLIIAAVVVHLILWQSWPLYNSNGSDSKGVASFYVNVFKHPVPVEFALVAYREPIPPLFYGLGLDYAPAFLPVGLTILAVLSVAMVFLIVRPWGMWTALLASGLYLADLPVQQIYHEIASEAFACLFLIAALLALRYGIQTPKYRYFAAFGLAIGLGVLSRPAGLGFLTLLAALLACPISFRRKLAMAGVAIGFALLAIGPWILFKGTHYGIWGLSRYSSYGVFYEAYDDELIRPGNGPATDRLINLINEHLLTEPAYKSAGVTLSRVLRDDGNPKYEEDPLSADVFAARELWALVDKHEGWNSELKLLTDVGMEGIRAHPAQFWSRFTRGVGLVATGYDVVPPATPRPISLYLPGERPWPPIFRHTFGHPSNYPDPSMAEAKAERTEILALLTPLKKPVSNVKLGKQIIEIWQALWPPLLVMYALTLVGIATNRGRSLLYLLVVSGAAFALMVTSSLFGNLPRYRLPVEPVFLIGAAIGFAALVRVIVGWISSHRSSVQAAE